MCWAKITLLTNMTRYVITYGTFDNVLESILTFETKSAVFHISWEENKKSKKSWNIFEKVSNWTKSQIKMGITDKIAEIEREIARTQKNKGKICWISSLNRAG